MISLDAGLRMDEIPALDLWDLVLEVFHSSPKPNQQNQRRKRATGKPVGKQLTTHAKTDSNPTLITFHQAEHILVPMLCRLSLRKMKP